MAANSTNLGHGFPSPGPQDASGERVMDHVFFLSRTAWKQAREEGQYDLVIIGTGFCGYAVAHRALSRNPHKRILMIERGPFFLPEHFQSLPIPFVQTLGGKAETFPWTLTAKTARGTGAIKWQHGMVPFFGGRSTVWSAWCPRPWNEEMRGWPEQTIKAAFDRFDDAEKLLRVVKADKIDATRSDEEKKVVCSMRPVYGALQIVVQKRLADARNGPTASEKPAYYRSEPAPLASDARSTLGLDFDKFAVPGELLQLVGDAAARKAAGEGAALDIVTDCVVERILHDGGLATGLVTSRGTVALGDAKLVLAMGALPPKTLVAESFDGQLLGEKQMSTAFSAHFITSVVARVPRSHLETDLETGQEFDALELGACYVAGTVAGTNGEDNFDQQYHVQLSALHDRDPKKNARRALRYMPDVIATASPAQLEASTDHVVFVCAVLGELDVENPETWYKRNPQDPDPTTASLLQVVEKDSDRQTWDAMDAATFEVLEVLSKEPKNLEYWHGAPDKGEWKAVRPAPEDRRVDALVHESSTLALGPNEDDPVDLEYKLRGTDNVYITGAALWPRGGSWNPTMTMVALAIHLADLLVPEEVPTPGL